ncbi:hypothetical protein Tco_0583918 [Tanacetum coccineum]
MALPSHQDCIHMFINISLLVEWTWWLIDPPLLADLREKPFVLYLEHIAAEAVSTQESLHKGTSLHSINTPALLEYALCKVEDNMFPRYSDFRRRVDPTLPKVLDFSKELSSLEPATKEMQPIFKGLDKVSKELLMAENDRPVSETFQKPAIGSHELFALGFVS